MFYTITNNYDTPVILHYKHIYFTLYTITKTTIPHNFITNHTYIYIYPIQQLRYPRSFITNTCIITFIHIQTTTGYTTYPSLQTHIFTFILNNNYDIPHILHYKQIYLHLYCKTTTIATTSYTTNTHIYTCIL